ncbi:hypothetical protein CYMTET_54312 [Cymbomonas tetramitiformis]|uniref:Ion transport domain-containing protein n=1 Tax=Cymbomonas tetramitiformis TaxID=36881 RepID=A0AAE0BGM7_9CHLO|nr:hypothetical protein CYMTET_54312 [Cymbomonas tetramitiformis]
MVPADRSKRAKRLLTSVVEDKRFEHAVHLVIFANCIVQALYDPLQAADSDWNVVLGKFELSFLAFFTMECILKVCAFGFWGGAGTYLSNPWNKLDFVVIVTGWMAELPWLQTSSVSGIRALRAMRPLKTMEAIGGIRILVLALVASIPLLTDVLLLCSWLIMVYGQLLVTGCEAENRKKNMRRESRGLEA